MAAARAEARKKAILARGTDRLAKLTTSARGEEAAMPTASVNVDEPQTNPSAWLPEQQQQFIHALRQATSVSGPTAALPGLSSPIGDPTGLVDPSAPLIENPFAALLGLPTPDPGTLPPGLKFPMQPPPTQDPKPKTVFQKVLPLLHLMAVWCLLAYFLLFVEPKAYAHTNPSLQDPSLKSNLWSRWVELGQNQTLTNGLNTFKVQIVPFFWAFTSLEIILHSLRFFAHFDTVQPPTLLSFALPHLPPPFPSIIINSLKYLHMGSLFLDDLAGIVVGIGFIIYFSGWFAASV